MERNVELIKKQMYGFLISCGRLKKAENISVSFCHHHFVSHCVCITCLFMKEKKPIFLNSGLETNTRPQKVKDL